MLLYLPEILLRSGEHIFLVLVAMMGAILLGIPLGILIANRPALAKPILGISNLIQTFPSLALFGFLIISNRRKNAKINRVVLFNVI
ncbi:hypothetical protein [Gloeocapsa sp. PCC 73106]|uniref:hypothetical protein n=1 Tax=Gloeocapsa sp. PCC 73106 TaxID=102232 RepID=UPI0002AC9B5E|nr:hypothetical protein [Gloeocapsa sp. PCC 73106]ELS00162.1 hypothetical protein GLO73106DRAFT_00040170 [Gloeocapsa sp. PCC 73106]